jgi:pimeloyl-ACP methyl ester carboxylesterase
MPRSRRDVLRAQLHAASILGATLDLPGTSLVARRADPPSTHEEVIAGVPVTIVRPAGRGPWPALVFMNGATPDGRTHPMVLRLSLALARTGQLVFIPDLPGVAGGELSPVTLATSVAFAQAAARMSEAAHNRIALAGVSIGGSLALLCAADSRVADHVSAVVCIAPYTDLERVMLLATTGSYAFDEGFRPYPVPPYLAVGLARSMAAMLPPTPATAALCEDLRGVDPSSESPLEFREHAFQAAGVEALAVFELLTNRDPKRFGELYAALSEHIRSTVVDLSPLHHASSLRAPVEIATAPRDRYFPVAESRALVAASPRVRLTVTSLLAHATPRLSVRYLAELGRLNAFFVRALEATATRSA